MINIAGLGTAVAVLRYSHRITRQASDMDQLPESMEALTRAPEASARHTRGESPPEIAVLGAWRAESLGEQAVHAAACRFFAECGWLPRSFNLHSLALGSEQ